MCIAVAVITACGLLGQTAEPSAAFEVASVKVSQADSRLAVRIGPASIAIDNASLRDFIMSAYGVRRDQVLGPDWIKDERFSINAKAATAVPEGELKRMLQALLAERFRLVLHREQRKLRVLALLVDKKDAKLQASREDEVPSLRMSGGVLHAKHVTISDLARLLTEAGMVFGLSGPVVDMTEIRGFFDFDVQYGPRVPDDPVIVSSIQDKLGLKLASRAVPVEVMVVDHAERPSAD